MQVSEQITQKSASNLALAFVLLPKEKRKAMTALYAFCREVDDVVDEEWTPVDKRRAALQDWRKDIMAACFGKRHKYPVNIELEPFIRRYRLPYELFDELIKGVEMDLDIKRYEDMEELGLYCYRVASVVGLLSIEIFGYTQPACREYALSLGKALQLTNILRDVRNDAERGRIYLPESEMRRFQVRPEEILEGKYSIRYFQLARHMANVAANSYRAARAALPREDRRAMATAELMGAVYWRLLLKLREQRFNVFQPEETKVPKWRKALLVLRFWASLKTGVPRPAYGKG